MQALFDIVAGLLSALAALAFAQFGVSLHGKPEARAHPTEVRRIIHHGPAARCSCEAPAPVVRRGDRA